MMYHVYKYFKKIKNVYIIKPRGYNKVTRPRPGPSRSRSRPGTSRPRP